MTLVVREPGLEGHAVNATIASLLLDGGNEEAVHTLERHLSHQAPSLLSFSLLAQSLIHLGQYETALECISTAAEESWPPGDEHLFPQLYLFEARCRLELGDDAAARRALENCPESDREVRLLKAWCALFGGDVAAVCTQVDRVWSDETDPRARGMAALVRGLALRAARERARALQSFLDADVELKRTEDAGPFAGLTRRLFLVQGVIAARHPDGSAGGRAARSAPIEELQQLRTDLRAAPEPDMAHRLLEIALDCLRQYHEGTLRPATLAQALRVGVSQLYLALLRPDAQAQEPVRAETVDEAVPEAAAAMGPAPAAPMPRPAEGADSGAPAAGAEAAAGGAPPAPPAQAPTPPAPVSAHAALRDSLSELLPGLRPDPVPARPSSVHSGSSGAIPVRRPAGEAAPAPDAARAGATARGAVPRPAPQPPAPPATAPKETPAPAGTAPPAPAPARPAPKTAAPVAATARSSGSSQAVPKLAPPVPAAPAEAPAAAEGGRSGDTQKIRVRRRDLANMVTIHLIDPDPEAGKNLPRLLEGSDYALLRHDLNGTDAIETFVKAPADVILLDVNVTDRGSRMGGGLMVLRQILELDRSAIILATMQERTSYLGAAALKSGAKGQVMKPFETARLLDALGKTGVQKKVAAGQSGARLHIQRKLSFRFSEGKSGFGLFSKGEVAFTSEVDPNGLVGRLPRPLKPGVTLALELDLPDVPAPLRCSGQVLYCKPLAGMPVHEARLTFVDLGPASVEQLLKFLRGSGAGKR